MPPRANSSTLTLCAYMFWLSDRSPKGEVHGDTALPATSPVSRLTQTSFTTHSVQYTQCSLQLHITSSARSLLSHTCSLSRQMKIPGEPMILPTPCTNYTLWSASFYHWFHDCCPQLSCRIPCFSPWRCCRGSLCCQSCLIWPRLSSSPWWCAASLLLSRNIWLHSSHGERLLEAYSCLLQYCLPSSPSEHLRCSSISSCAFHIRRSWILHSWQLSHPALYCWLFTASPSPFLTCSPPGPMFLCL